MTTSLAALVALANLCSGDLQRDARASTQECNTACQTRMTDCILDCDGVLTCELNCKAAAVGCVRLCTDGGTVARDLDAGPRSAAPARFDALDGGRAIDAAANHEARSLVRDH